MGTVESYSLHLYCDCTGASYGDQGHNQNIGEISGRNKTTAYARAKNQGWTITRDGRVLSPYCKSQGRKIKE